LNVPEVWDALDVNVALGGSGAAVRDVIVSPSGSEVVTVKLSSTASFTTLLAGAVTTGGQFTAVTVIRVVSAPVPTEFVA